MKKTGLLFSLLLVGATVTPAQPPPGSGWGGPRGRGGPGEPMGIIGAGPGSRTPVTGAPYSAVESTSIQQKLADGNLISRQESSKVYRDKDGRVRIEHTSTPPNNQTPQTRITIFDPVASVSYVLNPATSTATKIQLRTPSPNAPAPDPNRHGPAGDTTNVVTSDLGSSTVNGVPATGTRTVRTVPAGTMGNQQAIVITREVWVATVLKVPVQIKTSDPRFGTTDMEVANISQNDPDPTLFTVPSTYTVTTRGGGRGPGMGGPMRQGGRRN
jgi:hypothetical protein